LRDHFCGRAPLAIIIMGVAGCGKSTLGVEVASAIGCPFLEGDKFHSPLAIAKMRTGIPLTDEDRWRWLDRLGQATRAELQSSGIAVAACSALKRAYRDRLRDVMDAPTLFVFLDGDYNELWHRLSVRQHHFMPASLLASQFDILERPAPDECAITLDAGHPPSVLRDMVVDRLINPPQSWSG